MVEVDDLARSKKWSGILPDLLRYPVSGAVAGGAIVASIYYWSGGDIEPLVMSYRAFTTEPWRLLTSCLPHGDWLHLVFNVYWLMRFGRILETKQRRWVTALLLVYLAAGSSAAEYAVGYGGIGLSGIGYGLFGFLWVASRLDRSFADSIDRQTAWIFVGWFFLCIILTELSIWRIANVAHGVGAVLGALGPLALLAKPEQRRRSQVGVGAVLLLLYWSATGGRGIVNRGGGLAFERSQRAYDAMEAQDCVRAVELYKSVIEIDGGEEDDWYFLGVCYQELGRLDDALPAFRRAYQLDSDDEDNKIALTETLRELSTEATSLERYDLVIELIEELQTLGPLDASDWESLGRAHGFLGHDTEARAAYAEALRINPENEERYQREMTGKTQP